MVSTVARRGVNASAAIKVPCIAASTGNLTLSGEQTVDGIALVEDDRCFVKDQTDTTEIGIYTVSTGTWTRALDFDGSYDVVEGTIIPVSRGTANADTYWRITNTGTITIGTTALTVQATTVLGSAILNDGSVKMIADFAPNVTDTYDIGTKTARWVDGVFSGDMVFAERSDHSVTPAAGYGQAWVRDDAPCRYMFTDDAGNDFPLSSPPVITDHIRAGNLQIINGDTAGSSITITSITTENVWVSVGPTGSGADNIWTDIDVVPANATMLVLHAFMTMTQSGTGSGDVRFHAASGDVASPTTTGKQNLRASIGSNVTTNDGASAAHEFFVPIDSNLTFKTTWRDTGATTRSIVLDYRGFITD